MRINQFLKEVKKRNIEIHEYCIYENQEMVAYGSFDPYRVEDKQTVFSLSKTLTAIGIMFLVQEEKIQIDDPIIKYFPGNKYSENMDRVTIENLLTMASGHEKEPIMTLYQDDIIQAYLLTELKLEPGSIFVYNSVASFMLSAIVTKASGESLIDYLTPRLLDPLKIDCYEQYGMEGINTGGYGLNITVKDVARLGLFLLNKGEGLLDPKYVDMLSSKHIETPLADKYESRQGYGYQCWMSREGYRMDGAFGQYCYILPKRNIVIALNSGVDKTQDIHDAIFDVLLLDGEDIEKDTKPIQIDPPIGNQTSLTSTAQNNRVFTLENNQLGISSISFSFDKDNIIEMDTKQGHIHLEAGHNAWLKQYNSFNDPITKEPELPFYHQMEVAGCFDDGCFSFEILYTNTPFHDTYIVDFNGDEIIIEYHRNASFLPKDLTIKGTVIQA